jgi:hypothetical protein
MLTPLSWKNAESTKSLFKLGPVRIGFVPIRRDGPPPEALPGPSVTFRDLKIISRIPEGQLGSGLPEFDWFVVVHWNREAKKWQMVTPKFFGKKKLVFRIALPTRSLRHQQAAVHTIWSPGSPDRPDRKIEPLYGFRKLNGQWQCVTNSHSLIHY